MIKLLFEDVQSQDRTHRQGGIYGPEVVQFNWSKKY